jgi:hypothetical protein
MPRQAPRSAAGDADPSTSVAAVGLTITAAVSVTISGI